jgi:hypothetical protein
VQHGHQHRSKETQAALNSTQIATPESPIVGTNATFAIPQLPRGKENSGQKWKAEEESIVTEASADKIKNEIKLHYLRKRSPDVAMSRLYGKNPNGMLTLFSPFARYPSTFPNFKISLPFSSYLQSYLTASLDRR